MPAPLPANRLPDPEQTLRADIKRVIDEHSAPGSAMTLPQALGVLKLVGDELALRFLLDERKPWNDG